MKRCICTINSKEKLDDDKLGFAIAGVVLIAVLIVGFVASWIVGIVIVVFISLLFLRFFYPAIRRGHSKKCAFRQAFMEILSIGNLISP
jgi:fatty acid desaturase